MIQKVKKVLSEKLVMFGIIWKKSLKKKKKSSEFWTSLDKNNIS